MRNLRVLNTRLARVDEEVKAHFSCDLEHHVYLISKDNTLYVWNLESNEEVHSMPLEGDDLLEPGSEITGLRFIPDLEAVCLVTRQGDILLFDVDTRQAEVVGSLDSGIVAMAWSPDYELVIFATAQGTLVEMTKDWDVVTEVSIYGEETPDLPSDWTASLSWRGDGKVFACLARDPTQETGRLSVYDRACVLECQSDPSIAIEMKNLAWKPSGSVVTCTQRLPHRYDTIFFERNGLRHGEFTFRDDKSTALFMEWNCASDLLAVLLHVPTATGAVQSVVQVWYMNNWHWYLKQEVLCGVVGEGEDALALHWHEEDPMRLNVLRQGGDVRQYLFQWDCDQTLGLRSSNQSTIAVIDGEKLLLTPLRRLVPPPPMAATTLTTSCAVNQVFFSPHTYDMFVVHSNHSISCYRTMTLPAFVPAVRKAGRKGLLGEGEPPVFDQNPELLGTLRADQLPLDTMQQWVCLDDETILALSTSMDDMSQVTTYQLVLMNYSIAEGTLSMVRQLPIPEAPLRLYRNADTGSIFLSLTSGAVYRFALPDQFTLHCTLPTPCYTIQSVVFGQKNSEAQDLASMDDLDHFVGKDESEEQEILVALNNRSRLYVNGVECSRECNSFAVHERYILFTTLTHKLRFIDHSYPFSDELLETTPKHTYDICNREVERGASLVSVIPHDTKVILQMPRGNLEVIYPRALLLSQCRRLLDQFDYQKAFLEMRRHRIDLNLIHDHDPAQFMAHVEKVVADLGSSSFLNLFLSSLTDEDVTVTLFPPRERKCSVDLPAFLQEQDKEGKVNAICSAIRGVLQRVDPDRYLLSTLTTLVKENPPRYGEALEIVRQQKGQDANKAITAESALDYLVFLVDVEKLYEVALSLYDFELAIMVASKSQKDPKEYLPFLKSLHDLDPPAYRKYSIDLHLKQWTKALTHISSLADDKFYQEAKQLITREHMYSLAIRLYADYPERVKELRELYGEYLFQNAAYEESGIMYHQCGALKKALDAYLQTSQWQMVFALASQLEYDDASMKKLAMTVASSYRNMGHFEEAAQILIEYANDHEEAIECLIQGCVWTSAIRLCHKHGMADTIKEQIAPAAIESATIRCEMIEERIESFEKQFARLKVVKRTKLLMPQVVNLPADANLGDVFSETSSFASSQSSFSYVTRSEGGTKQRKRKKKKRLSGKEGSLHEEEFLVEALKKLIPSKFEQEEVRSLLKMLMWVEATEDAELLSDLFQRLVTLVEGSLDVLIAPLTSMPGHEEEEEEDRRMKEKIETKEKLDRLYQTQPWSLSCILPPN